MRLEVEGNEIRFECENKFDPNRKVSSDGNGLGNELLAKRLELTYPGRHSLDVSRHEDYYRVQLKITHGAV